MFDFVEGHFSFPMGVYEGGWITVELGLGTLVGDGGFM